MVVTERQANRRMPMLNGSHLYSNAQ